MIHPDTLQQAWDTFLSEFAQEGNDLIVCTNICKWLMRHFFPEGTIHGYHTWDNPTAVVAKDEDGHDFLIVDGQIIDFWQKALYDEFFPLSLPLEDAAQYYGDSSTWTQLPQAA